MDAVMQIYQIHNIYSNSFIHRFTHKTFRPNEIRLKKYININMYDTYYVCLKGIGNI